MPRRSTPDDFWKYVVIGGPDECWPWTGYIERSGYGRVMYQGRLWLAHRLACVLSGVEIMDGVCRLHRCDNPPCCNPAHTFDGTRADNVADMISKGRARTGVHQRKKTHCPQGHEYTPDNTRLRNGHRSCKACGRDNDRRYRRKEKTA